MPRPTEASPNKNVDDVKFTDYYIEFWRAVLVFGQMWLYLV